MKTIFKTIILSVLVSFAACNENENTSIDNEEKKNTKVSITDAPIDNAQVSGAFVTITDVKVDGISLEGFSATTIGVLALQNGKTETLGNLNLNTGTVSEIILTLDYDRDENGEAPGSFVETKDGVKHKLTATSNTIVISDNVDIVQSATNEIVIDFDLRKTIIASNEMSDKFDFVTNSELNSGLRFVNNIDAGEIRGTVNDNTNSSDKIIVFAYESGTFSESEMSEQGQSGVLFANATTSAVVSNSGSYELNFLKDGDYELQFASFEDSDNDGEFELKGMLEVESALGVNLNKVSVSSSVNLNLLVTVKGMK